MKFFLIPKIAFLLIAYGAWADAASFSWRQQKDKFLISISGPIEAGDYRRFIAFIVEEDGNRLADWNGLVLLDSPGGNLRETLDISSLLRAGPMFSIVLPGATCASSCFFLFAAGSVRAAGGKVGIHRPFYDPRYYGNLPAKEAEQLTSILVDKATREMEEMQIPRSIQEILLSVPSNSVHWLTEQELDRIGQLPMWLEEQAIAKCGFNRNRHKFFRMRKGEEIPVITCIGRLVRPRILDMAERVGDERQRLNLFPAQSGGARQ
jgi:hypothetical protein